MTVYEVGYTDDNAEALIECNYYDSIEEAEKSFNYIKQKIKQFKAEDVNPYIHKAEIKDKFCVSDWDFEEIYSEEDEIKQPTFEG